ncbi:hypothetical protein ACE14D_26265 [Streptomyces sp. Act-28]
MPSPALHPTLRRPLHRPLVAVAAGSALMAVASALGLLLDDRLLLGAPMWAKPFKFAVSFVAYCLSLAWMLSLLPLPGRTGRRVASRAGTVVAVSCAVEMVLVAGQAARGRRSHFNYATPFDAAVYTVMGATVAVLWFGTLAIAVLLFRARLEDRATAWTIRLGTVLALVGAAFGVAMSQPARSLIHNCSPPRRRELSARASSG